MVKDRGEGPNKPSLCTFAIRAYQTIECHILAFKNEDNWKRRISCLYRVPHISHNFKNIYTCNFIL